MIIVAVIHTTHPKKKAPAFLLEPKENINF
jgi:hypothetical protein